MISRRLLAIAGALVLGVGLLSAEVAGKYKVEVERPEGAQGGGRGGMMAQTTLDLKEEGGVLTGKMEMGAGERSRTAEIENGKIADGKFSFETKLSMPQREIVLVWEGTVEGDTLKGTRSVQGGNRPPQNFTAKKAE